MERALARLSILYNIIIYPTCRPTSGALPLALLAACYYLSGVLRNGVHLQHHY